MKRQKLNSKELAKYAEIFAHLFEACVLADPRLSRSIEDVGFFFSEIEDRSGKGESVWSVEFPDFDVEKALFHFEKWLSVLDAAFGRTPSKLVREIPNPLAARLGIVKIGGTMSIKFLKGKRL
jgi:hypothetical protein